ncbi:hypothetical protein ACJMK2_038355 [Sinanodonta woodiana]|uniref:Syntaxin 6/10/61 N-terminal domain-containing protein n=1 Tax=Sinanodonta woodiana TaxID=1069815 RepID=A0ABD3WBT9_SINWO
MPCIIVKEVHKSIQTSKNLYTRWCELVDDKGTVSKEEYEWTTNELRNTLRSIEWDLEDLEETVDILLIDRSSDNDLNLGYLPCNNSLF